MDFLVEHGDALDEMADEAPGVGVAECFLVGEFAGLAEVVPEDAHQEDVAIEFGVVSADKDSGLGHAEGVFHEAAEVGVVQLFGGRGALEVLNERLVGPDGFDEGLQRRALDFVEDGLEVRQVLLGVSGPDGEEVGGGDLVSPGGSHGLDDNLECAAVFADVSFHERVAFLGDGGEEGLGGVPHDGAKFAGAVPQAG